MENLFVGQKLWWVPSNRHGSNREVGVTKVGRKWAQLSNHHRIDVQTLVADAGEFSSPGTCYRDQAEYEAAAALERAWSRLRQDISLAYQRPEQVSLENIEAARSLLGLGVRP